MLKAGTVDTMVGNESQRRRARRAWRGVMGWGLGNVNVVMKPEALRYPANRGEYGWDGTAGTIFWIDPAVEHRASCCSRRAHRQTRTTCVQRFKTAVQAAVVQ